MDDRVTITSRPVLIERVSPPRTQRSTAMSEEIANVEMARAWDGEEGGQWAQFADEYDNQSRYIWAKFLATDPIGRADRVLDIGCGNGQSTRDAARVAHEGSALGIDLSSEMLA